MRLTEKPLPLGTPRSGPAALDAVCRRGGRPWLLLLLLRIGVDRRRQRFGVLPGSRGQAVKVLSIARRAEWPRCTLGCVRRARAPGGPSRPGSAPTRRGVPWTPPCRCFAPRPPTSLSGPSYAVPARRYLGGISVSSPLINDVTVFLPPRPGAVRTNPEMASRERDLSLSTNNAFKEAGSQGVSINR